MSAGVSAAADDTGIIVVGCEPPMSVLVVLLMLPTGTERERGPGRGSGSGSGLQRRAATTAAREEKGDIKRGV